MSARQPFVPQRPASRISKATVSPKHTPIDEPFRQTGLLNDAGHVADQHTTVHKPNSTNKPLNISAFVKKGKEPQAFSKRKRSLEFESPNQTFPHPGIAAPRPVSPFVSRNPIFLSEKPNPELKALAPVPQETPDSDFGRNQAHIATNTAQPKDGTPGRWLSAGRAQLRAHSPATIDDPEQDGYPHLDITLNEGRGAPPGPNRSMSTSGAESQTLDGPTYPLHEYEDDPKMRGFRRSNKRVNRPEDVDGEMEYGSTKRHRDGGLSNKGQVDFPSGFSPQLSPSPNHDSRSHSVASSVVPAAPADQGLPQDNATNTLLRIFGPSFHACEQKDLEEFEEAKKKWTECSIDEWKAGAEELASKFSKMIDFVKDHMSEKLKLYASLHDTVSGHQKCLERRERDLKEARETLVRDGANVVGNKNNFVRGSE